MVRAGPGGGRGPDAGRRSRRPFSPRRCWPWSPLRSRRSRWRGSTTCSCRWACRRCTRCCSCPRAPSRPRSRACCCRARWRSRRFGSGCSPCRGHSEPWRGRARVRVRRVAAVASAHVVLRQLERRVEADGAYGGQRNGGATGSRKHSGPRTLRQVLANSVPFLACALAYAATGEPWLLFCRPALWRPARPTRGRRRWACTAAGRR